MVSKVDKYVIEKVREKRLEKGISQSVLAFEMEVSTSFIKLVESGKYGKKYNVHHINEIARVLECSLYDLLPENPILE